MGGYEDNLPGLSEPSLKYHPDNVRTLTFRSNPTKAQFQEVSLTGAVASQKVTEAYKLGI